MKDDELKSFTSTSKAVRFLCSSDDILTHLLAEVQDIKSCLGTRLTALELKVSLLVQTCSKIASKLDGLEMSKAIDRINNDQVSGMKPSILEGGSKLSVTAGKPQLKLVPMTNESDYPDGSWLGDPQTPLKRVRCPIHPNKLFHINTACVTPVRMALTMLDHLFTRDELAGSNISGKSRKGKKQLSPIFMYGIKCHLEYKFKISDKDWNKICQNIDAKCRFAYKKRKEAEEKREVKLKVLDNSPLPKRKTIAIPTSSTEEISFDFDNMNHSDIDFNSCVKVITETPCQLRILNATPAQLAQLQESQEIILAEEMLPDSSESMDEKSILINSNSEVSMNTVVMNGDDESLSSHLSLPPPDSHLKGEAMEVESLKIDGTHSHDLHQISDEHELTIHDDHLEEGFDLQVELDSRSED